MNPYQILQVPLDADDHTIRQTYLEAVKRCPPERDPLQFQRLSSAYDSIKDEDSRLQTILHPPDIEATTPAEVVLHHARQEPSTPGDLDQLKTFLRSLL